MNKRLVTIAASSALATLTAAGIAAPAIASGGGHGIQGGRDAFPAAFPCAIGVKSSPSGAAKLTLQKAIVSARSAFAVERHAAHKAHDAAEHAAWAVFRSEWQAAANQTAKVAAWQRLKEALAAAKTIREAAELTASEKLNAAVLQAYSAYFEATSTPTQHQARAACFASVKVATTTYRTAMEASRTSLRATVGLAQQKLSADLKAAENSTEVAAALATYRTQIRQARQAFDTQTRAARTSYRAAVEAAKATLKSALGL